MIYYSNGWFMGHIALLFLILGMLGFVVFFLPSFIAFSRGHPYRLAILLINFVLGWTGIVWIALFIWAVSEPDHRYAFNRSIEPAHR